jgi:hypothetical protein
MRRSTRKLLAAVALAVGGTALVTLSAPAQQAPTATRPAEEVLAQLGRNAGVVVLADATIYARLPMVTGAATVEGVERQLAELVRTLPAGATWIKIYVPAPANDRWSAEIVADYARAQSRLLGTSGRPAPPGTVELFGRPVAADKASEYITALNLKRVYLVTNPRPPSATATAGDWARLTPEQRDQYVQRQVQQLMRLDPAARIQALRQLLMTRREPTPQDMIMREMRSQLTEQEAIQLKQAISEGALVEKARGGK